MAFYGNHRFALTALLTGADRGAVPSPLRSWRSFVPLACGLTPSSDRDRRFRSSLVTRWGRNKSPAQPSHGRGPVAGRTTQRYYSHALISLNTYYLIFNILPSVRVLQHIFSIVPTGTTIGRPAQAGHSSRKREHEEERITQEPHNQCPSHRPVRHDSSKGTRHEVGRSALRSVQRRKIVTTGHWTATSCG